MHLIFLVSFLIITAVHAKLPGHEEFPDDNLDEIAEVHVNRISDQIREVLEHYKQPDPLGLPGVPIPDPMPIPDMKNTKSLGTLLLKNATILGLSKFRIEQIQSNLANMEIQVALSYAKLEVIGNYTLTTLFSRSRGGFNVTLAGVYLEGVAAMYVTRHGNLEANSINLDITFNHIVMDFQKLNLLGTVFQGMINTMGTFVFDSIKPFILKEINTNIRGNLNDNLRSLKQTFPNSIPPLDLAIAEGRKYVREMGYDPYKLEDYKHTAGIFTVHVTDILLSGLATFYRIGNVTVALQNNTLQVGVHLSTKQLLGKCNWEVFLTSFISKEGSSSFSVEYLQVETKLNQSLDTRNKPKLEELQLKVGNIQLRMDGTGTFDYGLEFLANVLPNILRYQIVDGIEGILKQRVQDILDAVDIDKVIESHLPQIDDMNSLNGTE